jgi:hypothetical protein
MQILSALDAISPAISRTKLVLFSPFRFGRTWKLGATAYLSVAGAVFLPVHLLLIGILPMVRKQAEMPSAVPIVIGIAVAITLLYMVVFYLCSRLRFAFFDIVLHHGDFVAPAWRKYGGASLRWTLFKVMLGTLFLGSIAWPTVSMGRSLMKTFAGFTPQAGQVPSPEFLHAIFGIYAAFFALYLVVGIFYLASSLLADFVVPQLALEDNTLGDAFRRTGRFVRREPGAVALYALMKVALFFVGAMAVGIAFYVALLAVALVAVIVGGLIGLLLHLLHVPTSALIVLAAACGGALYLLTFFYGLMVAQGTLFTFLESYLLYFLGGRFRMLGEVLEQSTPPPPPPSGPVYITPQHQPPPTVVEG